MAANAWSIHDTFKEMLGNKFIDLDNDTFYVILATSANATANTVTTAGYANITNELTTQYGYTQKTETITTPAWTAAGSTCTWDNSGADPVWTAAGGSIVARYCAIIDDNPTTPTADPIVCSTLLDNTPDDVTATDGNTLTITMHASGIFTMA